MLEMISLKEEIISAVDDSLPAGWALAAEGEYVVGIGLMIEVMVILFYSVCLKL
jgi:hypothetical protein